jgi:hypothetical protein
MHRLGGCIASKFSERSLHALGSAVCRRRECPGVPCETSWRSGHATRCHPHSGMRRKGSKERQDCDRRLRATYRPPARSRRSNPGFTAPTLRNATAHCAHRISAKHPLTPAAARRRACVILTNRSGPQDRENNTKNGHSASHLSRRRALPVYPPPSPGADTVPQAPLLR